MTNTIVVVEIIEKIDSAMPVMYCSECGGRFLFATVMADKTSNSTRVMKPQHEKVGYCAICGSKNKLK